MAVFPVEVFRKSMPAITAARAAAEMIAGSAQNACLEDQLQLCRRVHHRPACLHQLTDEPDIAFHDGGDGCDQVDLVGSLGHRGRGLVGSPDDVLTPMREVRDRGEPHATAGQKPARELKMLWVDADRGDAMTDRPAAERLDRRLALLAGEAGKIDEADRPLGRGGVRRGCTGLLDQRSRIDGGHAPSPGSLSSPVRTAASSVKPWGSSSPRVVVEPQALGAADMDGRLGARELGEALAAAAAGRAWPVAAAEDEHLDDALLARLHHGGDGGGLGAAAQRVGGVLDVAAGIDASARPADRGTDVKAGVGSVGALARARAAFRSSSMPPG